ncbi:lytic transglycosylase domain-containing protein [Haematobacter genomosp. 1]|uniref:Lytic transglycosylase n=1 Tax=Haematobacter genomosp. 1 TaxID=366618 RepID=A0A212AF21_9RHOB|nr:lytic transglycosylase domain-containing protein [Haematobacter genomosp. 1]OWJ79966.1 lytic transglycosylase [Haematobacter genomosp. 1]
MSRLVPAVAAAFLLASFAAPFAQAAAEQRPANRLAAALDAAGRQDWDAAQASARTSGPIAADIIEWLRLRQGEGSFGAYTAFVARHGDWPGIDLVRRRGEAAIPPGADPDRVIGFFGTQRPLTGQGALALGAAWKAKGQTDKAAAVVTRAWRELPLTESEQAALISAWPALLAKHHVERLDNMLWRERFTDAERMLPLVNGNWQALARARIALRRDLPGVDGFINAVPDRAQSDPGLAWERFAWRMRKSRYEEAALYLDGLDRSPASLGRPEIWAERRALLARREMRLGDTKLAYRLASQHGLTKGADYADLEWLAGYIALQRLNNPRQAMTHFRNVRTAVNSPISLGRAAYWEGRAAEAAGDRKAAGAAYALAAEFQTGFYGQLAAERIGQPMKTDLAGTAKVPDWRGAPFTRDSRFQAAELLQAAGARDQAKRFYIALADSLDAGGLAQLGEAALAKGEPNIALLVAKEAASRSIVLPRAYFPTMELARLDLPVERALALSIARRESEFDAGVVSSAGARGLMQVMPGTAEQMSRKLGVAFAPQKLTSDWTYNARMGAAYLAHLQEEFGGSVALLAAGYNAGPGRVREWIATYGDPRSREVDVVDWIESIPFTETRNYVMRVAEALPIYRARLAGKTVELRPTADLKSR